MRHEEVRLDGHPVLYSVYGDAHSVATKSVVLPEVVAEVTGRRMPDAGALVAVPTRHLLAFHPIVDGSAADALNDLATYAVRAHDEGPGPLSPRVYWWHDGRLTSLTDIDDAPRTVEQRPPRELVDVMALRALDRAGRLRLRRAARARRRAGVLRRRARPGPRARGERPRRRPRRDVGRLGRGAAARRRPVRARQGR